MLRQLLLNAEHLVSKHDLLESVWPDVNVVEASLPTAVRKLRSALGDDDRAEPLIETAQRIGYRITVPVTVEDGPFQPATATDVEAPAAPPDSRGHNRRLLAAAAAVAAIAAAVTVPIFGPSGKGLVQRTRAGYSTQEVLNALRRLDVAKIDSMIAAGWNPDAPIDVDRNNALNRLLEMCEWNPGHDRAKMLYVARALIDGGITLDGHNRWGDTPYSIAKAERYCGPDHPVTVMIHNMCYAKGKQAGDRCLATYELKPKR